MRALTTLVIENFLSRRASPEGRGAPAFSASAASLQHFEQLYHYNNDTGTSTGIATYSCSVTIIVSYDTVDLVHFYECRVQVIVVTESSDVSKSKIQDWPTHRQRRAHESLFAPAKKFMI